MTSFVFAGGHFNFSFTEELTQEFDCLKMFRLVKTVLVLSMCFHVVQSFYFPGVAPNEFELGTELTIKVGAAQPTHIFARSHTRTVHTYTRLST